MIETPLGVTRANEIASAHETVSCLVMGTSDLSRDLQANHTPERTPLLYRYSTTLLIATVNYDNNVTVTMIIWARVFQYLHILYCSTAAFVLYKS